MKEDSDSATRSAEDYQAGLEDSIRRCEELLACTPVTFLPLRRARSLRESLSACCFCPDELTSTTESTTTGRRNSGEAVSLASPVEDSKSEADVPEERSEASRSVCAEDASSTQTLQVGQSNCSEHKAEDSVRTSQEAASRSFSGDEVEIIIEATAKEEGSTPTTQNENEPRLQLKFCPLEDKPPRKIQRSKTRAPKQKLQYKSPTDFFTAITEVMDNLKSYIHLPSLAPDNNATGKERLNNLSKPRTEVYKRLAEVKQIIEEKQLKECSFKPSVGRKPDPNSGHTVPVLERLTGAQQQKEIRKRQARKFIEKEELAACSFQPQINHNSPYYGRHLCQPLPERFKELERRRRERLERAAKEQDHGLTFKPEINPKSVQLFKQSGLEFVDLADRLTTVGQSVHLECKNEIEQARKSTFIPEINNNTDEIIACSKQFGGFQADFFSRQQLFVHAVQEKKKQKENEIPPDFTFCPNIGNSDLILKAMCRDIFPETPEERVQRLAYKDKANQMQIRKKVADDYYGQFNFQPEIDEVSRLVGRSSTIKDLYMNTKGQELKKELEQAAEAEFQQKYPFRPTSFTQETEKPKFRSNFLERLQARKCQEHFPSYMQESWTMKELEEIKECTFKPAVNLPRPKDSPPAVIKGLDRHLELKQIAKQMKQDQENLEKKVFFSHLSNLPVRQYTIPKPFSFVETYKYETKSDT